MVRMGHGITGLEDGPLLALEIESLRDDSIVRSYLSIYFLVLCNEPNEASRRILGVLPTEILDIHIHPKAVLHQGQQKIEIILTNPSDTISVLGFLHLFESSIRTASPEPVVKTFKSEDHLTYGFVNHIDPGDVVRARR